jgi:hypothetical protein
MLEITAIQDRLGLSEHQTRRLLRALDTVLQPYVKRGTDNRILLDGSAIAILERGKDLWRSSGIPLTSLSETVAQELGAYSASHSKTESPNPAKAEQNHCATCDAHKELIGELRSDKDRLLKLLDAKDEQILALMPARSENALNGVGEGSGSNGNHDKKKSPSRWRAFMYVVFGR